MVFKIRWTINFLEEILGRAITQNNLLGIAFYLILFSFKIILLLFDRIKAAFT